MNEETEDLMGLVKGTLDEQTDAHRLADEARYSVAHTYRLFQRAKQGTPMAIRRRLLLERAAYELTRTRKPVTEVAFDAAFESLEGFSRAFRSAFGIAPSRYRMLNPTDYRIDTTSRIHFSPSPSSFDDRQGNKSMKLIDHLLDDHARSIHSALDTCEKLPAELQQTVLGGTNPFPWMANDETLLELLRRNATFAEPWLYAINNVELGPDDQTIPDLRRRLDENVRLFRELVHGVEEEGSWDLTFVDAACEPPQVFSYGSIILHVIVFNSHARVALYQHLGRLQVENGFGSPEQFA
jgi:AraC-like DNA-binding protein